MSSSDPSRSKGKEKEVCPLCHGTGFVRLDVPVGHPMFGKAVPCVCKRKSTQQQWLAKLRERSNLQHLKRMTFESFRVEERGFQEVYLSMKDALETAREFAANPSGWLVLTGPYGCGKTHLAAAIANYRLERGLPVLFDVVPDLLDHLRATYAPTSPVTYDKRFDQVRNVEVLILDDLGTQNTTPWATEKLYQLLGYRYNAELPTVITTNQPSGDMEPRLASRREVFQLHGRWAPVGLEDGGKRSIAIWHREPPLDLLPVGGRKSDRTPRPSVWRIVRGQHLANKRACVDVERDQLARLRRVFPGRPDVPIRTKDAVPNAAGKTAAGVIKSHQTIL